ncbi:OsmC family protein [Bacillus sp. FJAT-49736]|uniref:OsmC family protein n=1 Tax=Bacillus sp. FJAT-49736 TaxID=2833582 RepID=UPI001BCA0B03|nr:OsmC family protein [Bacillus sp. FJAT-49736]MBS4174486.1 OsmC family protein [Bacillus sp. FJAT-49736]
MNFIFENGKVTSVTEFGTLSISPNSEQGYRPFELFISSLVGCSTPILANILVKRKVSFEHISISVYAVRNPEIANRIEQICMVAEVESNTKMSDELAEKMADLVIKNCGMMQSVVQSIDISYQIYFTVPKG